MVSHFKQQSIKIKHVINMKKKQKGMSQGQLLSTQIHWLPLVGET